MKSIPPLSVILWAKLILFGSCIQNHESQSYSTELVEQAKVESPLSESSSTNPLTTMHPELSSYIESVIAEFDAIPEHRKDQLTRIALYVKTKKLTNEPANLTFICTHNSRRSHMSQVWAATAADYYGIEEWVHTYSGGTEITAFNARAVAAMERAGFRIENPGGNNPRYKVTYSDNRPHLECFSKKFDNTINPIEQFVAVMTCSEADKNCPYIPGASLRIPIPYSDPKESDGTDQETTTYDERCRQIATEMFYLMSQAQQ